MNYLRTKLRYLNFKILQPINKLINRIGFTKTTSKGTIIYLSIMDEIRLKTDTYGWFKLDILPIITINYIGGPKLKRDFRFECGWLFFHISFNVLGF